jgi:hypothetical protein
LTITPLFIRDINFSEKRKGYSYTFFAALSKSAKSNSKTLKFTHFDFTVTLNVKELKDELAIPFYESS